MIVREAVFIDAPPEQVWQMLMALISGKISNPMFAQIRGELTLGGEMRIATHRSPVEYRAVITELRPKERLAWRIQTRAYAAEHSFVIRPASGGSDFVQAERFNGLIAFLAWPLLRSLTRSVFRKFNATLKTSAERKVDSI